MGVATKLNSLLRQLCLSPSFRRTALSLVALALSSQVLGGAPYQATKYGDLANLKILLKNNPDLIFRTNADGATPLIEAAAEGNRDAVELLLANKADIHAQDVGRRTALHYAAENGHKDVVELLLANKAYVDATDRFGTTPLGCAAGSCHKDIVELLLANKADIEGSTNSTPLILAALCSKGTVKLLLANKANVNAKDNNGNTTLHYAAMNGQTDVVELLLANNADVGATNRASETPLFWAARDAFPWQEQRNNDLHQTWLNDLHQKWLKSRQEVAECLLAHGAEVDVVNYEGETPLRIAWHDRCTGMVIVLIRASISHFIANHYIALLATIAILGLLFLRAKRRRRVIASA
jgi:ankyrin repeat protein